MYAKKLTTFNVRKDSLTKPFWSSCYKKNHGVLLLNGFSEWVPVKNLIDNKVCSLMEVQKLFSNQAYERKQRILKANKPYLKYKSLHHLYEDNSSNKSLSLKINIYSKDNVNFLFIALANLLSNVNVGILESTPLFSLHHCPHSHYTSLLSNKASCTTSGL
ncbi:hypothetical protein HOG98_05565 [bacterium]|jgi:hypothetical protein|nr:hypothetical protein [bacterium]